MLHHRPLHRVDRVCEGALTNDFWSITLPNDLATSSPRSPSLFAFYAALVLDEARALFSDQRFTNPAADYQASCSGCYHITSTVSING